jgi:hypothetical protein
MMKTRKEQVNRSSTPAQDGSFVKPILTEQIVHVR